MELNKELNQPSQKMQHVQLQSDNSSWVNSNLIKVTNSLDNYAENCYSKSGYKKLKRLSALVKVQILGDNTNINDLPPKGVSPFLVSMSTANNVEYGEHQLIRLKNERRNILCTPN